MVLEAREVSCGHQRREVVHRVGLTAAPGEVLALVGPNGCGKSTLLGALAGIRPTMHGQVLVDGDDLHRMPAARRARSVAYLPQQPMAPDEMLVEAVVALGRHPHRRLHLPRSTHIAAVAEAMATVGCQGLAGRRLGELSGGERQRVWLAMALCQQSQVLLLDEPTAALDVAHQLEVHQLLRRLVADGRRSVLIVLHDLAMATRFCDRVAVLHQGRLLGTGSPTEMLEQGQVADAFGVRVEVLHADGASMPLCHLAGDDAGRGEAVSKDTGIR